MRRIATQPRAEWKQQAQEYGFKFHTFDGEPYWDETAYYEFRLEQIENDIEDPTEEIGQMCLEVVNEVVNNELLLQRFQIPEAYWDGIKHSWQTREDSLYSRLDLAYDGKNTAKLYENNADTPTSVYETGFWQWLWLEDKIKRGELPEKADQFNSLQEQLIQQFSKIKLNQLDQILYFSCCKDTEEDRGTVQYLQDCAEQAGIECRFIFIEDIGRSETNGYTDFKDQLITWMFKLYPWEFMFREDYGQIIFDSKVNFLEPPWKAILSNKALLAQLWKMFPNHPNLLATYFENDIKASELTHAVKKPIFAREGFNISLIENGQEQPVSLGPYGDEGFIIQDYCPLPEFDSNYTLIGSWLVNDKAAGLSIREDFSLITQDTSRFLPHIII